MAKKSNKSKVLALHSKGTLSAASIAKKLKMRTNDVSRIINATKSSSGADAY